jgi:anti-sigma regulatory factor (Ser/Thr protein kinase)
MRTPYSADPAIGPYAEELGGTPGECQIHVTAWCLSGETAARRARALLRSQVAGHLTDEAVLSNLDLMVCELATNAHRHAEGPCEMRILHHGGVPVVCEIADAGGGLDGIAQHLRRYSAPVEVEAIVNIDTLQIGGRGLSIVAQLSGGRCGTRTTRLCGTGQPGKSVWFALPLEQPPD